MAPASTGRTPDRSEWRIAREIFVADSTKEARKMALEGVLARDFEQYFHPLIGKGRGYGIVKQDPDMPDSEVTSAYMADNVWIVDSREEVTEKLAALAEEVGGFGVLLAMGHEWDPGGNWLKSMTLLKQAVMPMLDDLD